MHGHRGVVATASDPVSDLVDVARSAADAYGRPDLDERLVRVRGAVAGQARVLVVGGFKAGKTELVNALLAGRALPADDHLATVVPTLVGPAAHASVTMVRADGGRVPVAPETLADHVTERGNPGNRAGWSHAEVGMSRGLLEAGVVLVDTPGAGGLGSPAALSTVAELPGADAVVLASDSARELTAPEMALLRAAAAVCPVVLVVLTRTDLHPRWRRIRDLDRGHLAAAGLDVEVVPTSAALRLHAVRAGDTALDTESGVGDLTDILVGRVVHARRRRRAGALVGEVLGVCEQLAHGFRARLAALDPDAAAAERDLAAAQQRATDLRERAARWQQTLADGASDLIADVDHDLRERMRKVTAEAEESLDGTDPAKTWEQFATRLQTQVSEAAAANLLLARQRSDELTRRVADHFAEDGRGVLPPVDVDGRAVEPVDLLAAPDHEKLGIGQGLLIGMRGSYGGVLMVGMLTTLSGMALINPFSVGAGLLMGGKTLLDERKRALKRRQAEAKAAVRRHVDDVVFTLSKNSRDMLRDVHRALRDHYTRTAEELGASLAAAVEVAGAAAARAPDDRDRHRADLQAELDRVEAVAATARRLLPPPDPARLPPVQQPAQQPAPTQAPTQAPSQAPPTPSPPANPALPPPRPAPTPPHAQSPAPAPAARRTSRPGARHAAPSRSGARHR